MQNETTGHNSSPKKRRHRAAVSALVVLLMVAIGASGWLFLKYRDAVADNPKTIEQRTIQQVAEVIEAPSEKPSVVTVTDVDKLSNKELATRAKNGDKLLIYAENRRIIVFRPDSGKVVDMLTIRDAVSQSADSEAVKPEE